MDTQATATFTIGKWDERPYFEGDDGAKMTRAEVSYVYTGDIEGEGAMQYLMTYGPDGTGEYVGLECIIGTIGGRAGSFVLRHTGTFAQEGVSGAFHVVIGSGTGALSGLQGSGELAVAGKGPYPFALAYGLE